MNKNLKQAIEGLMDVVKFIVFNVILIPLLLLAAIVAIGAIFVDVVVLSVFKSILSRKQLHQVSMDAWEEDFELIKDIFS